MSFPSFFKGVFLDTVGKTVDRVQFIEQETGDRVRVFWTDGTEMWLNFSPGTSFDPNVNVALKDPNVQPPSIWERLDKPER